MNFNEIQRQPNGWSCLLTSFAMAYRIPVEEMIEKLGHDGSEVMWPELNTTDLSRRAFHEQELIDLGLKLGYSITTIHAGPAFSHNQVHGEIRQYLTDEQKTERLCKHLEFYSGVITGEVGFHQGHAIYWENGIAYNPSDGVTSVDLSFIKIDQFHIIQK